jgi:hypothetical protein
VTPARARCVATVARRDAAASLARCDSRSGRLLGVGELAPTWARTHELALERARAGAELGRDAAVRVRRALQLVEPGEHRGSDRAPSRTAIGSASPSA